MPSKRAVWNNKRLRKQLRHQKSYTFSIGAADPAYGYIEAAGKGALTDNARFDTSTIIHLYVIDGANGVICKLDPTPTGEHIDTSRGLTLSSPGMESITLAYGGSGSFNTTNAAWTTFIVDNTGKDISITITN
jgi:hypothetical protein